MIHYVVVLCDRIKAVVVVCRTLGLQSVTVPYYCSTVVDSRCASLVPRRQYTHRVSGHKHAVWEFSLYFSNFKFWVSHSDLWVLSYTYTLHKAIWMRSLFWTYQIF